MSYIHIPINNQINDIDEFINIHNRICEIKEILSNNRLIKFNFNININNQSKNNNKMQITNANFYIKNHENFNIDNNYKCPICYNYNLKNNLKILLCKHIFCINCFKNWSNICIEKSLSITCPLCRIKI
jgi:hypothetical protein